VFSASCVDCSDRLLVWLVVQNSGVYGTRFDTHRTGVRLTIRCRLRTIKQAMTEQLYSTEQYRGTVLVCLHELLIPVENY
jgi:hypothetical protein